MAGIYIPGMEMPSGCEGCFFLLDCGICSMLMAADCKHKAVGNYRWDENERHPECPLILVPDHGDLIDRKVLMDGPLNLREATKYGNLTAERQADRYGQQAEKEGQQMNIGDKVRFVRGVLHIDFPWAYPPQGTIGTVVGDVANLAPRVEWPDGTVKKQYPNGKAVHYADSNERFCPWSYLEVVE